MLAQERQDKILDIIQQNKIAKVSELSQLFHTTETTIRRDLDELQKLKKLRRVHGGAVPIKNQNKDMTDDELSILCPDEKKKIAREALSYIDDHDALFLDSSSTVFELARLLPFSGKRELVIVTNSFPIVSLLHKYRDFHLIHTGGEVKHTMASSYGSVALKMLQNIKVDKCFLGVMGIDSSFGYSDPNLNDAALKEAVLKASRLHFILADHTKFGEAYIGKFAEFKGTIDYLITNSFPASENSEAYEECVNLIAADEKMTAWKNHPFPNRKSPV